MIEYQSPAQRCNASGPAVPSYYHNYLPIPRLHVAPPNVRRRAPVDCRAFATHRFTVALSTLAGATIGAEAGVRRQTAAVLRRTVLWLRGPSRQRQHGRQRRQFTERPHS